MRLLKQFALASLSLIAGCAGASQQTVATPAPATAGSFGQTCAQPGVQCTTRSISLDLIRLDGSEYRLTLPPPTVIVQGDYVTVMSGQTVYIEAEEDGDKLSKLRLVRAVAQPEKTLVIKLQQIEMEKDFPGGTHRMMLTVLNPFSRTLKFHAGLMPLEPPQGIIESSLSQTATCPVIGRGVGSESWPEPLFQVVVGEFRFPDPSSQDYASCIY